MVNDEDDDDDVLSTFDGLLDEIEDVAAADNKLLLLDDDADFEEGEEDNDKEKEKPACPVYHTKDFPTLAAAFGLQQVQVPLSKASETTCRGIWPYWARFCFANNLNPIWSRPYGLNLYYPPPIPTEGDSEEVRLSRSNAYRANLFKHGIVIDFFGYMASQKAVSDSLMMKTKTWMNACLGCEFTRRILDTKGVFNSSMDTVRVGELREVKQHCLSVRKNTATKARENYTDLMGTTAVGTRISDEQEEAMILSVIDGPKAGGKVEELSLSNRVNFVSTYSLSRADGRRKNEHFKQRWASRFILFVKTIGPRGMWVNMGLSNDGKTNLYGHLEYTGVVIPVNPILCSSAWHGFSLFHRYTGLGSQKFPTGFLDYKTVMDIVTYASEMGGQFKHISKDYYGKTWDGFYKDAGVWVAKLTHQSRVQCEQELDDAGVDTGDISRLVGHITPSTKQSKAQLRSYLTNPPVRAMVQRAGGDHNKPETHQPCRYAADVSPSLISLLFPQLVETKDSVYTRYDECSSHEELISKRLCVLKHCINGMVHDFSNFLRMLASRMVDPMTKVLIPDSPTIYEKFCHGPFHDLFRNPGFQSTEFQSLVSVVRAAEDRYYNLSFPSASQGRMIETLNDRAMFELAQVQTIYMKDALTKMDSQNQFMMTIIANQLRGSSMNPGICATSSNAMDQPRPLPAHVAFANQESRRTLLPVATSLTSSEFCKNGKKRVRARSIPQTRRLQEERNAGLQDDGIPRPRLDGVDQHFKNFIEHLVLYENNWLQLEHLYGARWRTDRVIRDDDDGVTPGETKKKKRGPNARNAWYSLRRPLYEFVAVMMEQNGITRDEAIQEATELYESVPKTQTTKGPNIKVLCAKFKEKMKTLGWKPSKGRPKKKDSESDAESDSDDIAPSPQRRRHTTAAPASHVGTATASRVRTATAHRRTTRPVEYTGGILSTIGYEQQSLRPSTTLPPVQMPPLQQRKPFGYSSWEEAKAAQDRDRAAREAQWKQLRDPRGRESIDRQFAAAFGGPLSPNTRAQMLTPYPPRNNHNAGNNSHY